MRFAEASVGNIDDRLAVGVSLRKTFMKDDHHGDPASDPDKLKGPGGMTLRQIHEQVQKSVQRDREVQTAHNSPAPPQSRWQRWVRYVWGRSGRR